MGRKIMIVDKSATMRRILRGVVQANLNDAEVLENKGVADAIATLEQGGCHVILYAWDAFSMDWVTLYGKAMEKPGGMPCHLILLVSERTTKGLDKAVDAGFPRELVIPVIEENIFATINKVCSPISLRTRKRYCVPDTAAIFEQRQHLFTGTVVNISMGGMLCDIEYSESFCYDRQAMISLLFREGGKEQKLAGFLSAITRVYIIESNPDFSPKRLRIGIRFLAVSRENEAALVKIFEEAKVEDLGGD